MSTGDTPYWRYEDTGGTNPRYKWKEYGGSITVPKGTAITWLLKDDEVVVKKEWLDRMLTHLLDLLKEKEKENA